MPTFSLPGETAAWATERYSSDNTFNEPDTYAPLNTAEMAAADSALTAWSSVATISFTEIADTATDVGQIRFAWTEADNSSTAWAYFPDEYWASGGNA